MKTNKNTAENALGANAAIENVVVESKMTQANLMDNVLQAGGTWSEMVANAAAKASELQIGGKYTAGLLRGHLKYRINVQNKAWAKALVMDENGITK